ncbi:Uncharacterised protein [Escherichia coli]|nr:Uncharacterised protein [Escherichia coli]
MEFSVKSGSRRNSGVPASSWASSNHVAFLRLQNSSIKSAMGTSAALLRRGELEGKTGADIVAAPMFRMYFPSEFSLLVAART